VGSAAWIPLTDKIRNSLSKKSIERIKKSKEFAEIEKDIIEINKNKGVIKLAELMEKEKNDSKKKKEEEEKSFRDRVSDIQKPYVEESLNVLADLVEALTPNAGSITLGEKVKDEALLTN
jgi:hypothetical protein